MRKAAITLAFILTAILLLTGAALADADYGEAGPPTSITFAVNGEAWDGGEYQAGDTLDISIKWDWTSLDGKDVELPEEFWMELGDLDIPDCVGTLKGANAGEADKGTYEIKDGRLYIYLNEAFRHAATTGRSIDIGIEGTIPLDPEQDVEGKPTNVTLLEKKFSVTPRYKASGLNGSKKMSEVRIDEDTGEFVVSVTASVEATGTVKNVRLDDVFGDYLANRDAGLDITVTRGGETLSDSDRDLQENASGFTLYFDELKDEVVEIEYKLRLTKEGLQDYLDSGTYSHDSGKATNTLNATFTDSHNETVRKEIDKDTFTITAPKLQKTGSFVDEDNAPGLVQWTITLNSGILGDMEQMSGAVMNELGLQSNIFELLEKIGSGQSADIDENDQWWDFVNSLTGNSSEGFEGTIELIGSRLEKSQNSYDGSWTYTITFYTMIDGTQSIYENDVSINIMEGVTLRDHAEVGIGWDFQKAFLGETGSDPAAMRWQIDVEVPEASIGGLESITITDQPKDDRTSIGKQDYTHRVIMDSIRIGGYTAAQLANDGVTVQPDGNGFKITIEPTSQFLQGYREKTLEKDRHILITFETEAVDQNGKRDGSLEGNFDWRNDASREFVIDGTPNTKTAGDNHDQKLEALFSKSYVSTYGTGTVYWQISLEGSALKLDGDNWIGLLMNPDGLSFDLTDILPENTRYVPGSAYVRLSGWKNGRAGDPCAEELTRRLTVTDNGDTVRFSFRSDNALVGSLQRILLEQVENGEMDQWQLSGGFELWIVYETAIDDFAKIADAYQPYMSIHQVNTVTGEVNGAEGVPDQAIADFWFNAEFSKTADYDSSVGERYADSPYHLTNGKYNVPFFIDVNREMMSLGGGKGYVELKDTLGKSFELILDSVRVYPYVPDPNALDYIVSDQPIPAGDVYVNYDSANNIIYIRVPDGKYYRVFYWATIIDPPNTTNGHGDPDWDGLKDGNNSVEITLYSNTFSSSSTQVSGVFKPRGSGTSDDFQFNVYKYMMSESGMHGLEGAEFELTAGSFDAEGAFVPDETNPKPYDQVAADGAITQYTFKSTTALDHVFRITETKAPEGCALDETPRYFCINGYYSGDTAALPEGVELYDYGRSMYFENKASQDAPPVGGLSVTKEVRGTAGETDREFSFTVQLGDKTVSGTYGSMTFVNGVANFTLRHGQTVTATGLPAGVNYSVSEQTAEGYATLSSGATGVIAQDATTDVLFINTKDALPPKEEEPEVPQEPEPELPAPELPAPELPAPTGSLSVTKTVKGTAGEKDRDFSFSVMLSNTSVSGKYGGMTFVNGVAMFTLRDGQTITASGLPAGVNYSVSEQAAEGYVTTSIGDKGAIAQNATAEALFINSKDAPAVPKTGDGSQPLLWMAMALLALAGIGFGLRRRQE